MLHRPQLLHDAGVTHVLTVAADVTVPEHIPSQFAWLRIPVYDSPDEGKFLQLLPQCLDFINAADRAGAKCYVHCMYGVSRSAAVATAWIMRRSGARQGRDAYSAALAQLQGEWPDANPSYWFSKQLSDGPSPQRQADNEWRSKLHGHHALGGSYSHGNDPFMNCFSDFGQTIDAHHSAAGLFMPRVQQRTNDGSRAACIRETCVMQ